MSARPKLLDRQKCAALAKVSEETIKKYIAYGLIEPIEEDEQELIREIDILNLFKVGHEEFPEASAKPVNPIDNIVLGKKRTGTGRNIKAGRPSKESLELNKALKERIFQLAEERDWLRDRLESAEKSLETQQNLLLAESETIRQLLVQQQCNRSNRKRLSFLNPKRLLPWFG